ncbi:MULTISPECIES: PTS sugar transporter subunit IIB [Shouchella]|uniref:Phosphotransferase system enzyme IIB component n=2 Tax=Bacillaceae TaxID=186817 RepID=A0A060LQW0_9BACI|nr:MULTISPECIES: PTS sugar transporter subunit IIB [Bacillaceae]AIC93656.1 phosphotransferase system enzyme IIB component [Shouchella lehensis G1]RQW21889.1 PTS galactitol transporter subunit IIB [Bacillus sp. C1-1]
MKTIIVACSGALATSMVVASKVDRLLKDHKITATIVECRLTEIEEKRDQVDLIITTTNVYRSYGVPTLHGLPFLSGAGVSRVSDEILSYLT